MGALAEMGAQMTNEKVVADCHSSNLLGWVVFLLVLGFGIVMSAGALVFVLVGPGLGLTSLLMVAALLLLLLAAIPLVWAILQVRAGSGDAVAVGRVPGGTDCAPTKEPEPEPCPSDAHPAGACADEETDPDERSVPECPHGKAAHPARDLRGQLEHASNLIVQRQSDLDRRLGAAQAAAAELEGDVRSKAEQLVEEYRSRRELVDVQQRLVSAALGVALVNDVQEDE